MLADALWELVVVDDTGRFLMVADDSDTLCVHGLLMPSANVFHLRQLSGLSDVLSDFSFTIWKQKDVDEPKNEGWNILKGVCWSGVQTSAHIWYPKSV